MDKYGWSSRRILGMTLWWGYDLSSGLAVAYSIKKTRARFYGITIGNLFIGITWTKKSDY